MEVLDSSVGRGGRNRYRDVITVQNLLNDCRHALPGLAFLDVDGDCGPGTIGAIEQFQRDILGVNAPDGRVDPNGRTLRRLNELAREEPGEQAPQSSGRIGECFFPVKRRLDASYKDGPRRFGSNRSRGRKHAGCDLYAPAGTPIFAMQDGEVMRDVSLFYAGTYSLEIKHKDFVARYCEIKGALRGIKKGTKIRKGQLIGKIGKLQLNNFDKTMLHLEIYKGNAAGRLTNKNNLPFKRRKDLMDPTPILDKAQRRRRNMR